MLAMSKPDTDIAEYLDDFMTGFEAGPVGSPEFKEAVRRSRDRLNRQHPVGCRCIGCRSLSLDAVGSEVRDD